MAVVLLRGVAERDGWINRAGKRAGGQAGRRAGIRTKDQKERILDLCVYEGERGRGGREHGSRFVGF